MYHLCFSKPPWVGQCLLGCYCLLLGHIFEAIAQVPAYIYFASHNEMNDASYHGLNYDNAVQFATMRQHVRAVCDTIIAHDARYVMQVESNFILACLAHDAAATTASDILQWADATPQIDVEPHNHFNDNAGAGIQYNPYNYADLAYLLDSCGLPPPRRLMGGFIWRDFSNPPVSEDWTVWQTPQNGNTYAQYAWQPDFLWGGGSPGHQDDYNAFGIWQPTAPTTTQFGQHNPEQELVVIGGGCGEDFVLWDTTNATLLANRVISLLSHINSRTWAEDTFFTFKIMMNFRSMPALGYTDSLSKLLYLLKPYQQNGILQYKTVNELYAIWQEQHPDADAHFVMPCDSVFYSSEPPTACGGTANYSLQFMGNGTGDIDRLKIPIDPPTKADLGSNFTLEFWLRCTAADNNGSISSQNNGDGWITGNVVIDRDIYGSGDYGDYGIAIGSYSGGGANDRGVAFGVDRLGTGLSIVAAHNIADDAWHHIAVTRNALNGTMRIYIDGVQRAQGTGPTGDISYRDGRSTAYPNSDPYLVIGAEKHDAGAAYPSLNGYLDELRLSNNLRYTANFAPPTQAFAADINTLLLYHLDEGSGTTTGDSATNPLDAAMQYGGAPAGPVWATDSPFSSSSGGTSFLPLLNGDKTACATAIYTYAVPAISGSTYVWNVTGGTILSGQGTAQISVQWSSGMVGTVSIMQTTP